MMNNDYTPFSVPAESRESRERCETINGLNELARAIETIANHPGGVTQVKSVSIRFTNNGAMINVVSHKSRYISSRP